MVQDNKTKSFFNNYINKHLIIIEELKKEIKLFEQISLELVSCLESGGTVFWCGNGGSMADSSHLAAELMGRYETKRKPLKSIALGQDNSVLSCIANDFGYENIFSRELLGLANKNDYLIILSTSGNSKNVIEALKTANKIGMRSFALVGKGGGIVSEISSSIYIINENKTSIIQEVQITIGHLIVEFVETYLDINAIHIE